MDGTVKRLPFEEAVDLTGFGKYNVGMLVVCCMLILAMFLDIFGFSLSLPAVACDMKLSTAEQGLLSAAPLVGVMISSYAWGLCADTMGRRKTLLIAMPIGTILNLLASMAPTFASLVTMKFICACFTSSANAAGFVLVGESAPQRNRSSVMFVMACATVLVQFVISVCALPVFAFNFEVEIAWLALIYRPWRLLLQVITLPSILGCIGLAFLHESPKFLLSKDKEDEAVAVLAAMYSSNTGKNRKDFPNVSLFLDDPIRPDDSNSSCLKKMWNQTAPLFKPPLLSNSLKLYYILLCAYMTSTGYTMWVPSMTNAYFDGEESAGKTLCEVASRAARPSNNTWTNCNEVVQRSTLYVVMAFSGSCGILTLLLSVLVKFMGKKKSTLLVFMVSILCGVLILFVRIPYLSIPLFFMFLYVAIVLGSINTYLVEQNPTHLRGMATSLSVVVSRGFGFVSVQLIATLLADHCTPMITGYVVLVISGLIVAAFLPPDAKREKSDSAISP